MPRNLAPKEILREIDFTLEHKATLDEFGFGHRNIVIGIIVRQKTGNTYCGRPIPPELLKKAVQCYNDWIDLHHDLDRSCFPGLDELCREKNYVETMPYVALKSGLITDKQAWEWEAKREELKQGIFRNRFVELKKGADQLHDDYVEFLKNCLP